MVSRLDKIAVDGGGLVDANRGGSNFQDWTLDSLGNWAGFTDQGTSQTRTHDAANGIAY